MQSSAPPAQNDRPRTSLCQLAWLFTITLIFLGLPRTLPAAITIDGKFSDWEGGGSAAEPAGVDDAADLPDTSGDIRRIEATVKDGNLVLRMTVDGIIAPSVDETPDGKNNRYYYHWLLDIDNNPATGVSNSESEGSPTGLANPIGAELFVQVGWKEGRPDGVMVYEPQNNDNEVLTDFPWTKDGDTMEAMIPLADIGLSLGQTIAVSAFQEGASDGWMVDWMESGELLLDEAATTGPEPAGVDDAADLPDTSGDIRRIEATVKGGNLVLRMTVDGIIAPSVDETPDGKNNRYYYHWLLDIDNNPATGVSNSEYEGSPTGLANPIGAELFVQVGWKEGAPDGVMVYEPQNNDNEVLTDFPWTKDGDTMEAMIPLADIGLSLGQTIAVSAFQEGASDGWMVDWMESAELALTEPSGDTGIPMVEDESDHGDSSGDLKLIQVTADNEFIYLRMSVHGTITPTVEQTPEGMTNRYYYHWLLDIDNNPATGVSNSEYEGNPTGLANPIGAELFVQVGWKEGAPDGVMVYEPQNNDNEVLVDFEWMSGGDSMEAKIPMASLGLSVGQEIAFSAFQEGASNGWAVDWMESGTVTLTPPDSGQVDLTTGFEADPYGFAIQLEDGGGAVLTTNSVVVKVDDVETAAQTIKDDGITSVTGVYGAWLEGGAKHTLAIEYQLEGSTTVHTRQFPFNSPEYSVFPEFYSNSGVNLAERGFAANVTQISDFQSFVVSLHNNESARAERQLAGEFLDEDGDPYYNEITNVRDRWEDALTPIEGPINWHEMAPEETGHFSDGNGYEDQPIPLLDEIANGIVVELLTFVELKAGFHQFAVNTTGGYKVTGGPDGRDKLAANVGIYEGRRNYSYEGDHYFNILAEKDGIYPLRLLWFHSTQTKEHAQLELYSVINKRRILVNDPTDPDSVKAYRSSTVQAPYVSRLEPASGEIYATPESTIEIEIVGALKPGTVQIKYDGAAVTPVITVDGEITMVSYTPPAAAWGSAHSVELSYESAGAESFTRSESFDYSLYAHATKLPPEWALPVGAGSDPGFAVRTVQSFTATPTSVAGAEALLATNGDFTATGALELINLSMFEGDGTGVFFDDIGLVDRELISGASTDHLAMEVIAYLELPAGGYTFGVNSDDGFRVTSGLDPRDNTLEFDRYDGGRGTNSSPQNLFDIIVETPGVYPFRMLWYQGTGDASAEWYSYDRDNAVATLINSDGGIKAFQSSRDPGAFKIIRIVRAQSGDVTITWGSQAGDVFSIEASSDQLVWFELDDGVPGQAGSTSFTEAAANIPAESPERYYRVLRN